MKAKLTLRNQVRSRVLIISLAALAPLLLAKKCEIRQVGDIPTVNSDCARITAPEVASLALGLNDTALGKSDLAQSFSLFKDTRVNGVVLRLGAKAEGDNVFGRLTLKIESDNGGSPSGSSIVEAQMEADQIAKNSTGFYPFDFTQTVQLNGNTKYWLRLQASYPFNTNNLILWAAAKDSLSTGTASYFNRAGNPNSPSYEQWLPLGGQDQIFQLKCRTD